MDPSVQTPRAQLGGDGGSLEEKVEKAAARTPPNYPKARAGRHAPHAPITKQSSSPPSPPHVGAPAFSSPPAHLSNLPEPTAEDAWGVHGASNRRPRKRASAPGTSFRTHAGNEYS